MTNTKKSDNESKNRLLSAQNARIGGGVNFLVFVGGVLLFAFFVAIAYVGRSLLIPLILAIVLWYLINLLSRGYQQIPLAAGHLPQPVSLTLAFATILLGFWIMYSIVASNAATALALFIPGPGQAQSLVPSDILADIRGLVDGLPSWMNIQVPSDEEISRSLDAIFNDLQRSVGALWTTTRQAITQVTATASTAAVVVLYLVFIFMEQGTFEKKIRRLTETQDNYMAWHRAASEVTQKLNAYVVIKFLMSLLTAVISFVILLVFQVPFAPFWALLVFVLNFIPVIGSIIAWFLPMIVVLIGDYSLVEVLSIGLLLLGVQQLVGSFIEPRIAGNALNLSPLVILLSLAFWGALWGVLGLFIAVPLTVGITTILSRFDGTRWVAILLSQNGRIGPR